MVLAESDLLGLILTLISRHKLINYKAVKTGQKSESGPSTFEAKTLLLALVGCLSYFSVLILYFAFLYSYIMDFISLLFSVLQGMLLLDAKRQASIPGLVEVWQNTLF